VSVAIKICGLTREEDVVAVCEAGADFGGFVFFPKSKRFVPADQAQTLVRLARSMSSAFCPVGVTVNLAVDEILRLRDSTGITWFQLHGTEAPEDIERLRQHGLAIIKAVRVGSQEIRPPWNHYNPDFFLCDTLDSQSVGGTGQSWDLRWLPQEFPVHRTFIAGGLTCDNVDDVLKSVTPFGVDVSSGVEIAPGKKDPEKIRRFIERVRAFENNRKVEAPQ
jgi:phosphoribosylanthranilate isomerase